MIYTIKQQKKNPVFERLAKKYPEINLQVMLKKKWVFEVGKGTPQYRILLTKKGFEMLKKPKQKIEREPSFLRKGVEFYSRGFQSFANMMPKSSLTIKEVNKRYKEGLYTKEERDYMRDLLRKQNGRK